MKKPTYHVRANWGADHATATSLAKARLLVRCAASSIRDWAGKVFCNDTDRGIHCYLTRNERKRDASGAKPFAVIVRPSDQKGGAL